MTQTKDKADFSIHPATKIGSLSLTVSNLELQTAFYQQALGFKLLKQEGNQAVLGADKRELLHLIEQPGHKRYHQVTGLYHFAVLFPNRRELARVMARLFVLKYPNHPTDHILTKTTYLEDPEGNGIELYCESPEDGEWFMDKNTFGARRSDGTLSDGRELLDVDLFFRNLEENPNVNLPAPPETRIGHIHLHVRDFDEALDFYHGVIGFDKMGYVKNTQMGFVSAGGYHHHVGLNTWQGVGAPPPPADALGLRYFKIELPDQSSLDEVIARVEKAGIPANQTEDGLLLYDPSQNGVMLIKKK
jgi:catechol 2,3-dioxygenase